MLSTILLFREALYGALVIAIACSVLGVWVVLRRIVSLDAALGFLEQEARAILPADATIDYAGESRQLRTEGSGFLTTFLLSAATLGAPRSALDIDRELNVPVPKCTMSVSP